MKRSLKRIIYEKKNMMQRFWKKARNYMSHSLIESTIQKLLTLQPNLHPSKQVFKEAAQTIIENVRLRLLEEDMLKKSMFWHSVEEVAQLYTGEYVFIELKIGCMREFRSAMFNHGKFLLRSDMCDVTSSVTHYMRITPENREIQRMFRFRVKYEHRCEALRIEPVDAVFVGFVQYHKHFKTWHLTVDGISYTSLEHAYEVMPIY